MRGTVVSVADMLAQEGLACLNAMRGAVSGRASATATQRRVSGTVGKLVVGGGKRHSATRRRLSAQVAPEAGGDAADAVQSFSLGEASPSDFVASVGTWEGFH